MPWKDKTVEELRREFIGAAEGADANISALCREFGISRTTAYKWLRRGSGGESLSDGSHVPLSVPGRTDAETEQLILRTRIENPGWGAAKILRFLANKGHTGLPCVRTGNAILKRGGLIEPAESLKHRAFVRFEREKCNQLWQADFKGEFPLLNGTKCFPLDILDDHSRFCIGIYPKTSTIGAKQSFESAFREYGLPDAILSDNGVQFAGFKGGFTLLVRWLMDIDVLMLHGRVMHPQTQGKIERFHRSMKTELLSGNEFLDIEDAGRALNNWRRKYNEERPHEALSMNCPADMYCKSRREYPEKIRPYEYSGDYHLIKVNSWGYLRFDTLEVYIGQTFENTRLEVRPMEDDKFAVCYRNFRIGLIDAREGTLISRVIQRLP